jgi:hypothetical protein
MHFESPFWSGKKRLRAPAWRLPRDLATYGLAVASVLLLAVFAFVSVSAANAELQAKTAAQIDLDNGAVCARLDFAPATPAYDRCLAEMNELRDRDRALHQDVF